MTFTKPSMTDAGKMTFAAFDYGEVFGLLTETELVFGMDRAAFSLAFDAPQAVFTPNGGRLYAKRTEDGMHSSYAELSFSCSADGVRVALSSMHDLSFALKGAVGGTLTVSEESKNGCTLILRADGDGGTLTAFFYGDCRHENGKILFRRGEGRIVIPCRAFTPAVRERGFEKEADRCLGILEKDGKLSSESELFPLLLLVSGLKNACFSPKRAKRIEERIPFLPEQERGAALAVLKRYYRTFCGA